MATKKTKTDEDKQETPFFELDAEEQDAQTLAWIRSCRDEAEDAKEERMFRNKSNFDAYHLRHDFSHKMAGQSKEVLSKQPMAVDQISTFFQQALTDMGDWFQVDAKRPGDEELMTVRPHEVELLSRQQLEKADIISHVGNGVKSGLLGALIISKVNGERVSKPKFKAKTKRDKKGKKAEKVVVKTNDKAWQLKLDLVRQENYFPDPTTEGLYEIEDMWMDLYQVMELSKGPNAIYDPEIVKDLPRNYTESAEESEHKRRETDQLDSGQGHRGRVKITEYWGKILDRDTGEVLFDNVVATMANDEFLIRRPEANPLWHQSSPYVTSPLFETPHAVWPKALMDSPTQANNMLNEIYNLIVDGAMKAVNSITQVRVNDLVDPAQVSDGIPSGTALQVKSSLPHGAKVAEPVITGDVPSDALEVMNIIQQEFNASALTSDLRAGVTPQRSQSATATVEASNTITSIFQGVAKMLEDRWIKKIIEKSWSTIAQNAKDLDEDETREVLGAKEAEQFQGLSPQDLFVETVNGMKFKVSGIAETLNNQRDLQALMQFLQIIGGSDILTEAFLQKYDFNKVLGMLLTKLGIDKHKLELPQLQQEEPPGPTGPEAPPQVGAEESPDQQSQIPQPQAQSLESILGQTAQGGPGIGQSNFPG